MLKYANCTTKVRSNVYNQQDILHGFCSYFNSVISKVSKHFCAILRRNQRCKLNEPSSFPCHFMSVELSFYTYLMTIVSFSVNGNEVVFHFSNSPQKLGIMILHACFKHTPDVSLFSRNFFVTDFRRDFKCSWSLLSYHFACLKFGINTLSKLSCNGWQSQWVSWHTFP